MKTTHLVALYPKAWRERYGEEFQALLANEPLRPRLVMDILLGALDARFAPQAPALGSAEGTTEKGGQVMRLLTMGCAAQTLSRAEQVQATLWTLLSTIAVSAFYIWSKRFWGDSPWREALGVAAFPAVWMLVTARYYWRGHSVAARFLLAAAMVVFIYLVSLLAAWI